MAERLSGGLALTLPGIEDLEPLGRGGSATVYRGRQTAFHRDVAVKVLDQPVEQLRPRQFAKELRALGALSGHPHIVAVYDAGSVDSHSYMVMPFLSGGSLEDRLRRGPLPPAEAVRVGVAIAEALEAAHLIGVRHRDIKPANILFDSYDRPQLADFGIARFADSTQTQGLVAATIGYAAPEVLAGQPTTPQSDLYSLGATLHAALRGGPPFDVRPGELPIAHAVRVISDDPLPLTGVAPELAAVIARAMAKDPSQRFQTAAALRSALLAAGSTGDSAGHARRSARPRRRLAAAAALAAAIAGAVVTLSLAAATSSPHRSASKAAGTPTTVRAPLPAAQLPSNTAGTSPVTQGGPAGTSASAPAGPAGDNAGSLAGYVADYYRLVDAHALSQSWAWLSPAYQSRLGFGYYQDFWNSVRSVEILDVTPGNGNVVATLRYQKNDGTVQTERTMLVFTTDAASGRRLISDTKVLG